MKKLLIIGDFPSATDLQTGTPFQSRRDSVLIQVLEKGIEADMKVIAFDVLFPDTTKKEFETAGPIDPKAELELNKVALFQRIKKAEPLCLVAVGAVAMEVLTGVSKDKLKEHRGKILDYIGDTKIKVVPVYESYLVERVSGLVVSHAKDLLRAYNIAVEKTVGGGKNTVTLVRTWDQFMELMGHVKTTREFCFDFETSGLDIHDPEFHATILSVSFQAGSAWVIPLRHKDTPLGDYDQTRMMAYIRDHVFTDPLIRKTGHNVKYDLKVARQLYGIERVEGRLDDTMLMKHLIDEISPNGLKDIVGELFPEFAGYDEEVDRYSGPRKWIDVPLQTLVDYSALDTDLTLRVRTYYEGQLLQDMKRFRLYRNLVMSLLPVLADVEFRGMLIDRKKLLKNIERADELMAAKEQAMRSYKQVKRHEAKVKEEATAKEKAKLKEAIAKCKPLKSGEQGAREKTLRAKYAGLKNGTVELETEGINFNSPPQLGALLYGKEGFGHKMPYDPKRKDYAPLTDKDTIVRLDDPSGFIQDLLNFRSLSKTKGTYLVGILERLDRSNHLHTNYLQHGTPTGRLSSRDPNLQNIPDPGRVKWPEAKEVSAFVKGMFVVPEGHTMLQVDYSQAELRLMAMYANETTMLEAYANGEDIHSLTAAKLNGMSLKKFKALPADQMKTLRYHAKAGNFGLIYGMSAEGFKEYAENDYGIKMTLEEAQRIRSTFFNTYPGILDYHEQYIAKANKFGGIRTFLGRFRHTPDIKDPNEYKRAQDERVAVNTPIQGAAAELTLFAMVMLRQRLDPRVRMVNTVHDAIYFYAPDELVAETVRIIRYTCTNLPTEQYFGRVIEGVTMAVDVESTKANWKEMQAYTA